MKTMDIVITEKYTSNGEEKKKYMNVGTLFVYDDGGMSIKINDQISVSGSMSIYEKKPREQQQPQQGQQRPQPEYRYEDEQGREQKPPQQSYRR